MKITKIETIKISTSYGDGNVFGQPKSVRTMVFIKILTNSHITGIGETYSGIYVPETIETIVNFLSKYLINENPLEKNLVLKKLNIPFVGNNGLIKSVISAIEIALVDISSKYLKIPMYKFLNKNYKKRIKVYASGGSVIFTPDQIKKDLEEVLSLNYTAYKMRVGLQSFKQDLKRVEAARELLQNKQLMIDAIMGTLKNKWDLMKSIKYSKELKNFNPTWLEEPLDPLDFPSYSKLSRKNIIPIAFGESFTSFSEFEIANNLHCSKYIQPDVTHCGFIDSKKTLKICKKNNTIIAMHSWGSPISTLANLHFSLAHSSVKWMEIPQVRLNLLKSEFDELMIFNNGYVSLDENIIGLGLDLNDKTIKNNKFIKNSGYKI